MQSISKALCWQEAAGLEWWGKRDSSFRVVMSALVLPLGCFTCTAASGYCWRLPSQQWCQGIHRDYWTSGFAVLDEETLPSTWERTWWERPGEHPQDFRAPNKAVRTVRAGPDHPEGQVVHSTLLRSQKRNTGVLFIGWWKPWEQTGSWLHKISKNNCYWEVILAASLFLAVLVPQGPVLTKYGSVLV